MLDKNTIEKPDSLLYIDFDVAFVDEIVSDVLNCGCYRGCCVLNCECECDGGRKI